MSEVLEKNKKIGYWTLLEQISRTGYSDTVFWKCLCDCGIERLVSQRSLRFGKSSSCGCSRLKHHRRNKLFNSRYKILKNGCWEWQGSRDKEGYSLCGLNKFGHRYSYEKHKGKIPENTCVCHTCDNRGCVNPDHLWLGSSRENQYDKIKKRRQSKGSRMGNAILDELQVLKIRKKLELGQTPLNISKEFGVSRMAIYAIRARRVWKHIDIP